MQPLIRSAGLLPNGRSADFYSIAPWREKHPDWFRKDLETLIKLLAEGKIKPVIGPAMSRIVILDASRAHSPFATQTAGAAGTGLINMYWNRMLKHQRVPPIVGTIFKYNQFVIVIIPP